MILKSSPSCSHNILGLQGPVILQWQQDEAEWRIQIFPARQDGNHSKDNFSNTDVHLGNIWNSVNISCVVVAQGGITLYPEPGGGFLPSTAFPTFGSIGCISQYVRLQY